MMSLKRILETKLATCIYWLRTRLWGFSRKRLTLIEDNDLNDLLAETGQLEQLANGNLRCSACGKVLTFDNLAAVVARDGRWDCLCDSSSCIDNKAGIL